MNFEWLWNLTAIGMRSLSLIAKFILVLCLAQYFQVRDLGLYGLMSAIIAYALFFLGMEIYNYTARELAGNLPLEQTLIIRDQFILFAFLFCILMPIFCVFFYFGVIPQSLCAWFFILIVFEHISNELMRTLIFLSRPHVANLVFFVRQGVWVFILLPIFYFLPTTRNLSIVFIAWVFGAFVSILIAVKGLSYLPWAAIWEYPIRWEKMREALRVAQPFLVSAFSALSILYIERFFVGYFCGIEAVGIYTFYTGIGVGLYTVINAGIAKMRLAQLLAVWKNNNLSLFRQEALHMLKYTTVFVVLFVLLSMALVYPFVKIINKPIYLENISIFYLILFGAACRCIADIPLYTIYAQQKDRLLLFINLFSFGILLIGNVMLVPHYGLMGAAISSACGGLVLLVSSLLIMAQSTLLFLNLSKNFNG